MSSPGISCLQSRPTWTWVQPYIQWMCSGLANSKQTASVQTGAYEPPEGRLITLRAAHKLLVQTKCKSECKYFRCCVHYTLCCMCCVHYTLCCMCCVHYTLCVAYTVFTIHYVLHVLCSLDLCVAYTVYIHTAHATWCGGHSTCNTHSV